MIQYLFLRKALFSILNKISSCSFILAFPLCWRWKTYENTNNHSLSPRVEREKKQTETQNHCGIVILMPTLPHTIHESFGTTKVFSNLSALSRYYHCHFTAKESVLETVYEFSKFTWQLHAKFILYKPYWVQCCCS